MLARDRSHSPRAAKPTLQRYRLYEYIYIHIVAVYVYRCIPACKKYGSCGTRATLSIPQGVCNPQIAFSLDTIQHRDRQLKENPWHARRGICFERKLKRGATALLSDNFRHLKIFWGNSIIINTNINATQSNSSIIKKSSNYKRRIRSECNSSRGAIPFHPTIANIESSGEPKLL